MAQLQVRLLEFLKLRALVAQEGCLYALELENSSAEQGCGAETGAAQPDPFRFRRWLALFLPDALALYGEDLLSTFKTARRFYVH